MPSVPVYTTSRIPTAQSGRAGSAGVASVSSMSLAFVTAPAPAFRIRTIIADSPAAEAGLMAGDIITAVDGRPAGELTLAHLRQQFRIEGVDITLALTRAGAERQVTIRTRRLI